ncbi:MAG: DUF4157 domain-containing protein [Nitrosomonas sp.]|nr:DUF4157 domain-containing protein [Nitrosomonas sp.]
MKQSLSIESESQQARHSAVSVNSAVGIQAFADNRESTAAQRQLKVAMVNSPQAAAQRKISQLMNNNPRLLAQRKMLSGEPVQRVEEDELLQKKSEPIQRVEEEELQKKAATDSPAQLKEQSSAKPNNTGLPDNLKSGIENLSGMSMDSVRVHYNSSQPAQLNALAYAQGTDIHVAPGQEQHLPHEAWHIVQQARGRVQPTMQMKDGVPVNDDQGLEHEADVMGRKAVGGVIHNARKNSRSNYYQLRGKTNKAWPGRHEGMIQRMATVEAHTGDKGVLVRSKGKVKKYKNGTSAGSRGWLGVTKYQATATITSKDEAFENVIPSPLLQNVFTTPEAGHVLAQQNGGNGGDSDNVFAQDGGTNNGTYKSFEYSVRKMLDKYDPDDDVYFKAELYGDSVEKGEIKAAAIEEASAESGMDTDEYFSDSSDN